MVKPEMYDLFIGEIVHFSFFNIFLLGVCQPLYSACLIRLLKLWFSFLFKRFLDRMGLVSPNIYVCFLEDHGGCCVRDACVFFITGAHSDVYISPVTGSLA